MKINWGTGLVIGMTLFIAFIMYMVVTMMTDDAYDHDLVAEDYYRLEMELQGDIDARKNAAKVKNFAFAKAKDAYIISLDSGLTSEEVSGKVILYRPSDERLDREFPLQLTNGKMQLDRSILIPGRYDITLDYEYQGKRYLVTKVINF
jgi:hypothetical protein